jgi:glutathione S-transferase
MAARLFGVPASHPCAAVERAFALKGVAVRRIDLPPPLHAPIMKARFGRPTVPCVVFEDGEKVAGSLNVMRALDARAPEPPLYPTEHDRRAAVEQAERWGEEVLQPLARRLAWAALVRKPAAVASYSGGARLALPTPRAVVRAIAPGLAAIQSRRWSARGAQIGADLAALEAHLDQVDRWIADGVLGAPEANAADLQIGASLRLLLTLGDLEPRLRAPRRRAGAALVPRLARRDAGGRVASLISSARRRAAGRPA